MPYNVNSLTKDQWKTLRTAAGVEKTSWWAGSGPSVGSKLEAWQTKRDAAKVFRKQIEQPGYQFKDGDDKKICDAKIALVDLGKALLSMYNKLKEQKARTPALNTFQTEVKALYDQCVAKEPKWTGACTEAKAHKGAAVLKALKEGGL